jgi:hypothetical protein
MEKRDKLESNLTLLEKILRAEEKVLKK